MSDRDYEIVVRKDSTIPEGRARVLRRMSTILTRFRHGVPDRANCFFYGLKKGWVLSGIIGQADSTEVGEMLPPRPPGGVIEAIPYGPEHIDHPEISSLTADDIPDAIWFEYWMGIKKTVYFYEQEHLAMPERFVLAWLGFLRGELEGRGISEAEYDKLRALLPPVFDDLTPLVEASQ